MHFAPRSARAVVSLKLGLALWLTLLLSLALSSSAWAEDSGPNYARNGWSLAAGGVGSAFLGAEDGLEDHFSDGHADVDRGLGFNLSVGYRGDPHLGVEVAFELMDDVDFDLSGGESSGINTWTLMALTKPYLMTGQIQPFVKAGLGIMHAKVPDLGIAGDSISATEFAVRFGGGVDFYATEHVVIVLGLDYVLPTGDIQDFDYLAFEWGLKYRF